MGDDRSTFDTFVAQRSPALWRCAYLLCHDVGRAEDLVQDALVKAHKQWARIDAMQYAEAYVRRIVVTEFLGWRRRRASTERIGLTDHDPGEPVPDPTAAVDARDAAWRAMAGLPDRQRAVLVLRYYLDQPDAEIAGTLHVAEATVRSLAARALATLRADHATELEPS